MEAFISTCLATYHEATETGLFTQEEVLEAFDNWFGNGQEINRDDSSCRILTYLIENTETPEDLYLWR